MKITVAGLGYVGMANAVLLAQRHDVTAYDIDPQRVALVTQRRSPIVDAEIEQFLASRPLRLHATTDPAEAFTGAELVLVATPTNYDPDTQFFDTSSVEAVIDQVLQLAPPAIIVIKSTIPVGFTPASTGGPSPCPDPLLAGVPSRGPRALRQPAPEPHHRRRPGPGRGAVRRPARRGCRRSESACHADRVHRSRGDQAVLEHLSGDAGGIFQRTRHVRRATRS